MASSLILEIGLGPILLLLKSLPYFLILSGEFFDGGRKSLYLHS